MLTKRASRFEGETELQGVARRCFFFGTKEDLLVSSFGTLCGSAAGCAESL